MNLATETMDLPDIVYLINNQIFPSQKFSTRVENAMTSAPLWVFAQRAALLTGCPLTGF